MFFLAIPHVRYCTIFSTTFYPLSTCFVAITNFAITYFDVSLANQQGSKKLSPCPIHIHILRICHCLLHVGGAQ